MKILNNNSITLNSWEIDRQKEIIDSVLREMRFDSQSDILSILSQTLTKKSKLKLMMGSRSPYANLTASEIWIPRQVFDDNFVDWILKKGITLHESFHILFTGNLEKTLKKLGKSSYDVDYNLLKAILNPLEDVRIEYLGMNEYKGCVELVSFVNTFFYRVALKDPEIKKRMIEDITYALAFEVKGYKSIYPDRELMDELLKIAKKIKYVNFEGAVKIALKIYDLLVEKLPPEKQDDIKKHTSKKSHKTNNGIGKTQEQDFNYKGRKSHSELTNKEKKEIEKNIKRIRVEIEKIIKKDEEKLEKKKVDEPRRTSEKDGDSESEEKSESEEEDYDDDNDEEYGLPSGDDGEEEDGDEIEVEVEMIGGFSKETVEKIQKVFGEEFELQEKIEKQLKIKGDVETEKLKKEFIDSLQSGLDLVIPKDGDRFGFDVKKAESIASMITNGLRNKIIVGKTPVSRQTSGKLNLKGAVRSFVKYDTTGEFDDHFYDREVIETPEHSVLVMVDCSGSMTDKKTIFDNEKNMWVRSKSRMAYAKETVYILGKVFESLDVKTGIRGFEGRSDILVKRWDDKLNVKKINGLTAGSNTPTSKATKIALRKMDEVDDKLKMIFTITDGGADHTIGTKNVVDMAREKGVNVFGIFYGTMDKQYEKYFKEVYGEGNFIMTDDSEKLKEEMIKLYEKVLKKASYGFNGSGG